MESDLKVYSELFYSKTALKSNSKAMTILLNPKFIIFSSSILNGFEYNIKIDKINLVKRYKICKWNYAKGR